MGHLVFLLALLLAVTPVQGLGYENEVDVTFSLQEVEDSPSVSAIDVALGRRLAAAAWNGRLGYASGQCYTYVWAALRSVLGGSIEALPVPSRSAYMFGDWVDDNTASAKQNLRLSKAKGPWIQAPEGSVLVWDPGQCGYSRVHGHIEISMGDGSACSDFCAPIATACGEPRIYVPTRR